MTVINAAPDRAFQWLDTPHRYGLVSRFFHWAMAVMLLWQFASLLLYRGFGDIELMKTILSYGPSHGLLGILVMVLVLFRGAWGLANIRRRSSGGKGLAHRAATLAHLALYGLMFLIPAVAVLRSYGSGRGWSYAGMQVIPSTGERVEWLVAPGNIGHGLMAWALLALIVGHAAMAIIHHVWLKDDTLRRMAG